MSKSQKPTMPKLSEAQREKIRNEHNAWLSHIMINAIDGCLIGIAVGIAIIAFDINGIGSMLSHSQNQIGYTLMLLAGFAQTFGMVVAGMSVWFKAMQEE